MKITIHNIKAGNEYVDVTLQISASIEYLRDIESPISIAGRILLNGKTVSLINEVQTINEASLVLKAFDKKTENERRNGGSNSITTQSVQLISTLSTKAIQFIEDERERNREKSVDLQFEFVLKSLSFSFNPNGVGGPQNNDSVLEISITKPYVHFTIKQSDWINHFSENIGIGRFLLLELSIPKNHKPPKYWEKLYSNLTRNLTDMDSCIKKGDWGGAMSIGRKFAENIKIGDGKPGHQRFKNELNKILKDDQHTDKGIENLHDAIWNFFEFTSKYIHEKDTQGNPRDQVIPNKEDAYFVYSLSVGLLNLIGKKLSKQS